MINALDFVRGLLREEFGLTPDFDTLRNLMRKYVDLKEEGFSNEGAFNFSTLHYRVCRPDLGTTLEVLRRGGDYEKGF